MTQVESTAPDDLQRAVDARMAHVRHKLLVLSGKGGVGKSTVAVNLARALARAEQRVGLLDLDLHGPSVPVMLHLEGQSMRGGDEGMQPIRVGENLVVCSMGFLLRERDTAVACRGPMKFGLIRQFLADVEWGELDYLVMDLPPGTGDEPMAICHLTEEELPRPPGRRPNRGAVIVTTPQRLALVDVRRCIRFCREVGMPVHGLVENMSGFVCPSCGTTIDPFHKGGGQALALETQTTFLGRIPMDPRIVDAGESESELGPGLEALFDELAEKLVAATDG